jgi:hypothetical protein
MARIREAVSIAAPAGDVWRVVHIELDDMPRWAGYVSRAEYLDGGEPGAGSRIRYELALPGGGPPLILQQTVWEPPARCEGLFVEGPVLGSWAYRYREQDLATELVYEAEYEMAGVLRFVGRMLQGRYEQGVRDALRHLKRYVEDR